MINKFLKTINIWNGYILCNQKIVNIKVARFKIFFIIMDSRSRRLSFYIAQSCLDRNLTFPAFLNTYGFVIRIVPRVDSCIEIITSNGHIAFTITSELYDFLMTLNREGVIIIDD